MQKSTATLVALLTLIVGYLLGSALGISDLQGRFGNPTESRETVNTDYVACEEKFADLTSQLVELQTTCSPSADRVSAQCQEDLEALRLNFANLREFCVNPTAPTESKYEAD
jgi:hypothetical protein